MNAPGLGYPHQNEWRRAPAGMRGLAYLAYITQTAAVRAMVVRTRCEFLTQPTDKGGCGMAPAEAAKVVRSEMRKGAL